MFQVASFTSSECSHIPVDFMIGFDLDCVKPDAKRHVARARDTVEVSEGQI